MPLFEQIVENALQRLGQGMKETILYHYYRSRSLSATDGIEPEKFHSFLHEIFGQGSFVIEDIIVKCANDGSYSVQDNGTLVTLKKIFTCCSE